MDKLTVISGCLFLAADIFAIASIANPDWISTGDSAGTFLVDWDTTLRVFRCGRRERERGVNLLNSYLTLISMWINTIFAHKISH